MPKLTNKGLARKALKTIEPKTVEPIEKPNQLKSDSAEEQQNGAKLTKIEQEIRKAEHLLTLHERVEETAKETSRFVPVGGQRLMPDISEVHKTSIDKHVESMRFKIVWVANKLADELIHETSKKTKKDKEYIKGLVWSFGTMYDKLAGISTDTVQVHIPTKLLEGVKSAISLQISRVQQTLKDRPLDITPDPVSIQIARVQQLHVVNSDSEARVQAQANLSSIPQGGSVIDVTPTKDNVRSIPDVALPPTQDTTT